MFAVDKFWGELKAFYEKLEDAESKKIFMARILTQIQKGDDLYYKTLEDLEQKYHFIDENGVYFLTHSGAERKFILFGGGRDKDRFISSLKLMGYRPDYICDNNDALEGTVYQGIPYISFERLLEIWREYYIIISSTRYKDEIFTQLVRNGVSTDHIYYPRYNRLEAHTEIGYFDNPFFKPQTEEIYVDGGGYMGDTVSEFAKWAPDYKAIHVFEPDEKNYGILTENVLYQRDVICHKIGLGRMKSCAAFSRNKENSAASRIAENGERRIEIEALDQILAGGKVTTIKLDVEGAELEALKGAEHTIRKYHPKLAVCLYHNPWDVYEIPLYLHQIAPEYRFYLRNLSADFTDLILFATL